MGVLLLVALLFSIIHVDGGGIIHLWTIRHVESTHNAGVKAPLPPPKDAAEENEGIKYYEQWDAPPSKEVKGTATKKTEVGLTQLNNLASNFGNAAMSGTLKEELDKASVVQFTSSDLCRAEITALYARESLLKTSKKAADDAKGAKDKATDDTAKKAAEEAAKKTAELNTKLKASDFIISQYLREDFDKWNVDAFSRFKSSWRADLAENGEHNLNKKNNNDLRKAFVAYLDAAIPPSYAYEGGPEGRNKPDRELMDGLLDGVTFAYQGSKTNRKENRVYLINVGVTAERMQAFADSLGNILKSAKGNEETVMIAGMHSSWIKDFARNKKYSTPKAKECYDKIVKAIGIPDHPEKEKIGNGQMIDMKIELVNGKPMITWMDGYELQGNDVPQGTGTLDTPTRKVSVSGARFESFGDEYDDESSAMVEYNDVDYGTYFDKGYGRMPDGRVVDESESMMVSALIALDVVLISALICIVCCALLAVYSFVVWKIYDSGNKNIEYQNVAADVDDVM